MSSSILLFVNVVAALFTFFVVGVLLGALFSKPFRTYVIHLIHGRRDLKLARTICNPILHPGKTPWEAEAVLNPAALYADGKTHLIYRAIGMDGVSRLGYAQSANGLEIDESLPYPVYTAQRPSRAPRHAQRYSPVLYPSGGSWGGCEDPRMVAIDGTVYITYNAFDGWDYIRVALISISEEDFLAKRFHKWSAPNLLSAPGQIQKNWTIFPEKINGKFAVLHSITPKIEVAYVDDLHAVGTSTPFIKSWEGPRHSLPPREGVWDTFVRSAGPPPIKTDRGYLVLYHALDKRDTSKYQLGALLLDLNDPTVELCRAQAPVLSPDAWYENHGKPGIVYAGGAVVHDGMLFVYYGGSDKVVCVATSPLDPFLDALIAGEAPIIEEIVVRTSI